MKGVRGFAVGLKGWIGQVPRLPVVVPLRQSCHLLRDTAMTLHT